MIEEWINKKSIAVVGNAQSLFDKQYGNLIESYDIVCRFNLGIFVDSPNTHGTRTDIIVYNNYPFGYDNKLLLGKDKKHIQLQAYEPIVERQLPPMPSYIKVLEDQWNDIFSIPGSSGFTFLRFLDTCDTKEVGIFGFDWKKTITFYNKGRKYAKEIKQQRNDPLWKIEEDFIRTNLVEHKNFKLYE